MTRGAKRAAAGILTATAIAAVVSLLARALPPFPIPRAEAEFDALVPFLRDLGASHQRDQALFRRWAVPYGPLDLQVGRATHVEASILRNIYFGTAGGAFGIHPAEFANDFHCGPSCGLRRKADAETKLPRLRPLAADFHGLKGIDVVATWGTGDDFRVNRLFRIAGQQRATAPSSTMGFVPSADWTPVADADAFIAASGGEPAAVRDVLRRVRDLEVVALVRESGGTIRAVLAGIGENEAGVLFTQPAGPAYAVGDELADGRKIVVVLLLAPDAFYYETT
jgi:hypothetical protein